jgi:RNA polymerase sigma-70 factor (ECF subfamily)
MCADSDSTSSSSGRFPPTRWSLLIRAGSTPSPEARTALSELCELYWYPIYAYIRRKGKDHIEALDCTQEFFRHVIEGNVFLSADQSRGRFRSFLLTACRNFLVDGYRRAKRKEPAPVFSIDSDDAERRYRLEPVDHMTPEGLFDRDWALGLLDAALSRVAREYEAKGKAELFEHLKFAITVDPARVATSTIADRLGKSEEAVHTAVHRLRRRYREILLEKVSATLDGQLSTEEEIQLLFEAIR